MASAGKILNGQIKLKPFYFDCKDIAFTDGIYKTDCIIKNNSFIVFGELKYFQDVSAYPAITINIITDSVVQPTIITSTLPYANIVNGYDVPGGQVNALNNNNCTVSVQITGMTGSGITALQFQVGLIILEYEM